MDFIDFIENKNGRLEMTEKAGLYCVMQSNIPKHLQAYRCGLAGKPVDSATKFKSGEGSFKSRFAQYLNYCGDRREMLPKCLPFSQSSGCWQAARRMLPRRQADPAPSPGGCWGGCCLGSGGSRPAARRLLRRQPGSIRSTAPLRNRT